MNYDITHAGKWVAIRGNRVIAMDKTLTKLMKKTKQVKNADKLRYSLVPKTYIAGLFLLYSNILDTQP